MYKSHAMSATRDRRFLSEGAEIRMAGEGEAKKKITGYAAVFDVEAEIMPGFFEVVRPGAFTDTLREADIRALLNHDPNLVLGRTTSGTLTLWEDHKGLAYSIDPPNTTYANDLIEIIARGDVSQSSFGFRVIKDRWTAVGAKKQLARELLHVQLSDVSPVTFPAYAHTEVHVRGLVESLRRKQQAVAEIADEERRAIAAAVNLLRDFFSDAGGDHGCETAVLRMRLDLESVGI